MPPKKATATAAKATKATTTKSTAGKKATTSKAAASSKAPKTNKRGVVPPAVAMAPAPETRGQPRRSIKTAVEVEKEETEDVEMKEAEEEEEEAEEAPAPKKTAARAAPVKKSAPAAKKAPAAKATTTKKASTTPKELLNAQVSSESSDKENHGAEPAQAKTNGTKRKRTATPAPEEEATEQVTPKRATKKAKTAAAPAAPAPAPAARARKTRVVKKINDAPTEVLQAFVFGEGTSGELGLGAVKVDGKKPIDVKRPRLNPNLKDVVQIACGGMHAVALTKDNKILTWGVNDQGALGRDTTWDGGLRDMDDEDEDSEDGDDTGMNPKESIPGEIDTSDIEPDTKFVQVVASDSASFALTEDGQVYGWGTFRVSDSS
jgi:regulator of chromosome condensation